jgi:hypothetical protein
MATELAGEPVEIDETIVQRQCEAEYIEHLGGKLDEYDAILSLGCGVGVQSLADKFPGTRVLPGLNTKFMGGPTEQGVWAERCQGCGNCLLDYTGAAGAKSIQISPVPGMTSGSAWTSWRSRMSSSKSGRRKTGPRAGTAG